MTAMIRNDEEKEWMRPLLDFRNALDFRNGGAPGEEDSSDRKLRDFRRMSGAIQLFHDRPIPGPYIQEAREDWLRKLLGAQKIIQSNGSADVRNIELITLRELQEIRRIWVVEKHEMEDKLPRIYKEVMGELYPGAPLDDNLVLGESEMELLREACGEDKLQFELARELLSVERQQRVQIRRAGLFEKLEKSISRHYYDSREDAVGMARRHAKARAVASQGEITTTVETEREEIESAETNQI